MRALIKSKQNSMRYELRGVLETLHQPFSIFVYERCLIEGPLQLESVGLLSLWLFPLRGIESTIIAEFPTAHNYLANIIADCISVKLNGAGYFGVTYFDHVI